MADGITNFKTAKEGVQVLHVQLSEFFRNRGATCPIRPEMDKMKEEIIGQIQAVNNVHREEKYKELQAKLESQEKAQEARKGFWRKFWSGIGAAILISIVVNYALPHIWPRPAVKTEQGENP